MPYSTNEGQLTIDVNTNQDNFDFTEAVGCEPVEYSDKYVPSKYGIIFKEKIYISPMDHTSTALNIKLLKNGVEFRDADLMKHYFFQILDNDKIILDKQGWNQINLSHYLFRCNQGLAESAEEGEETKHNYVIQAVFDLHLWPECKTVNDQTEGITWCIKLFNSDTLALCKDTDKEDKEKALKASWETAEPGRAEKASASRRRYQLQQKQKKGEKLTEEDIEFLNEKRDRVKKQDMVEAAAPGKAGKAAKALAKQPTKAGKPADKDKAAAENKEEDEASKRVLPEPKAHINREIVQYLNHFKSKRLIKVICKDMKNDRRKRSDEEKQGMTETINARVEKEKETHENFLKFSESLQEKREEYRKVVSDLVTKGRDNYKTVLVGEMENRNKYRELISNRKDKEKALAELLG